MDTGVSRPRMRRLFNHVDNRLLDVAIDHGVFNEDRFLDGIEGLCIFQTCIRAALVEYNCA
jgi:DhnA family fructose-bisphosphate aldolase class Ia